MHLPMERKRYPNTGGHSYSEPGRVHPQIRRRSPSLSSLEIENTRKGVSNDRKQLRSTIYSYDDRDSKSIRYPIPSSSSPSTMVAPQLTAHRDRYVHPMLVGRFIPANEVRQEKLDSATPQSTPDLSEVDSHYFSGGSNTVFSKKPTNECFSTSKALSSGEKKIAEEERGPMKSIKKEQRGCQNDIEVQERPEVLSSPERQSRPAEETILSSSTSKKTIFASNSDQEEIEGSKKLLMQAEKRSLCRVHEKVCKKVHLEPTEEGKASQVSCDIQCPSKKRKSLLSPDACRDLRNIKLGTRVAVYWDGEDEYFEGTVTRERENHKRRFFIEYDDGDQEWIDFGKHTFHLVDPTKRTAEEHLHQPAVQNAWPVANGGKCNPPETEMDDYKKKTCQSPRPKKQYDLRACDDWVQSYNNPKLTADPNSSDDSETDEDEIMDWAVKMFGIRPPIAHPKTQPTDTSRSLPQQHYSAAIQNVCVYGGISETVKRRRSCAVTPSNVLEVKKSSPQSVRRLSAKSTNSGCRVKIRKPSSFVKPTTELDKVEETEARRKKELARALTAEEIQSILGEDDCLGPCSTNWVRRSVRQPSKYALNSPRVKDLVEKLKSNDPDMVVLKMKKYVNDPNTPCLVIDAVLAALEENTNCEALYIQNFNEGMRDEQMMSLLQVLQRSSCKIWCLNIGETYKVKQKTWKRFAVGLQNTKITHMYASEHVISTELKDKIRSTIRDNRSKHTMHCDPNNLDTIVKCTHCWWNPVNTKSLRPYLNKRGYDQILRDTEFQGLPGSTSGATLL